MKNFQDFTVSDYLGIFRRRIWYFLVPAVVVSAGACVYAWLQVPYYKSETTIQVTNRILPDDYIGSLVRESPTDRIESVRQQIRSRSFMERIVQDLQLAAPGTSTEAAAAALSASVTFDVSPPQTFKLGYIGYDPVLTQSVVRRLGERVMLLNDTFRQSVVDGADSFLDEELRLASNALVEAENRLRTFNEEHFRGLPAGQVDSFTLTNLQSQLAAADTDLADTIQVREAARRRLEEQRNLQLAVQTPPPLRAAAAATAPRAAVADTTALEFQLANKRAELDRISAINPNRRLLMRDVADLERRIADVKALVEKQSAAAQPPSLPETPDGAPVLPMLPGVDSTIQLAEAELNFELQRLNRLVATKEKTRQALAGQVSQLVRRMNLPAELAQELASINQDLKTARDSHSLLANKKLSAEMAAKVDTSRGTFRTVDEANLPQFPEGPNRPRSAALGSIFGILLGMGLVVMREYVDTTLRDEEEATSLLKLPVLTSVPVVRGMESKSRFWPFGKGRPVALPPMEHEITNAQGVQAELVNPGLEPSMVFSLLGADARVRNVVLDPKTIAGEQYRLMRTSLSLMRKKRDKLQTILISSTIPNEGKTFASCCLASILAQESGKKVLLIDADFRTASASKMLGLNGSTPATGLSDILRGDAQLENSIARCSELSLYFLPAGKSVEAPTELLASPSLETLIRQCEELFDWIIIDSPPILALADANILLPVCDSALLVVRAGKTPVKLVKDSIHRMGDDRICGVLMNGVRQIAPSRYYGHYYKYSG